MTSRFVNIIIENREIIIISLIIMLIFGKPEIVHM